MKIALPMPCLMGVLNVTPDSFSDGGDFFSVEKAIARGLEMVSEGAAILDIGGESTGPESQEVSLEEELKRVIPVIRGLREKNPEIMISIDTWKAEVARQALEAGATMVNDVTALRGDLEMAKVVAKANVPVILMYSKDATARTTSKAVDYEDVIQTIRDFLAARVTVAEATGIRRENIWIDPGMGAFVSKKGCYSLEILRRLEELKTLGLPIVVGASRKGFIGEFCGGNGPKDRLEGSLAAATIALLNGASVIRAHDVKEHARVLKLVGAGLGIY
ncbi:MAG: dihydropteroate synthase [Candidatus Gracilibacteria bacterium]